MPTVANDIKDDRKPTFSLSRFTQPYELYVCFGFFYAGIPHGSASWVFPPSILRPLYASLYKSNLCKTE